MTQPCKNFKNCRGYAFDRKAKLCSKCWKKYLDLLKVNKGLKDVDFDGKNITFEFGT